MKTRILLTTLLMCMVIALQAQTTAQKDLFKKAYTDKAYVKQGIITEKYGSLYIQETNGYSSSGFASTVLQKIKDLKSQKYSIDWVAISPQGKWIIIYDKGKNVAYSTGIPEELKQDIKNAKAAKAVFNFFTLNDNGDYVGTYVISGKQHFCANSNSFLFKQKPGTIKTAWYTNKGKVFVFGDGNIVPYGIVHEGVTNAIQKYQKNNVTALSFTDSGNLVICLGNGKFTYSLRPDAKAQTTTTTQQKTTAKQQLTLNEVLSGTVWTGKYSAGGETATFTMSFNDRKTATLVMRFPGEKPQSTSGSYTTYASNKVVFSPKTRNKMTFLFMGSKEKLSGAQLIHDDDPSFTLKLSK